MRNITLKCKSQMARFKNENFGFTLIELLVVVSIIGILTALIMVNFNSARERARDIQRKSDLDQIKKALRLYYNDYNAYPSNTTDNKISGCSPAQTFDWGDEFVCNEMVYMNSLPQDPSEGNSYNYQQISSGQDFCLWAMLENKSDGDIERSHNRCPDCSVGEYDYVVCAD